MEYHSHYGLHAVFYQTVYQFYGLGFLENAFVWEAAVCVCVCMPTKLLVTSSMIWHDMDPI